MCKQCNSANTVTAQLVRPTVEGETLNKTLDIVSFVHCRRCLEELPSGASPRDYARTSVGFTPEGIQVWCLRHDLNITHIGFNGHQLPMVS